MKTIKRITDAEIIALNDVLKRPCITDGGECFIVTSIRIYDDGERFEVDSVHDVNVLATEREAREWVAKMMLGKDDADIAVKHAYTVRCHTLNGDDL